MAERTRKTESRSGDRRANRTILGRTIFLMVIFGVVVFIPLFWKLWDVQISQHDKLEEQAIDQQTRDLLVTAPRGTIYDAKGNRLAVSADVHNIVISPKDIVEGEKAAAERAVAKAEEQMYDLEQQIQEASADYLKLQELYEQREALEEEILKLYGAWETLSAQLEEARG